MSRALRVEFPGAVYHVTARGNGRAPVFLDARDREAFLAELTRVTSRYALVCHAYCLMGNHYHLVVETPRPNLALAMRHLNSTFAQGFNRQHGREGHLFQGRYNAVLIERESHLLEVTRYVVLNPVRAGVCNTPERGRWSSYSATAGLGPAPRFLTVDWILGQFGRERSRAEARYRAFVSDGLGTDPFEELRGGLYLGGEEFVRRHSRPAPVPDGIRRPHWQPFRPSLAEIIEASGRRAIAVAHREYGYRLREIAEHLGVHAVTVGRRLRRLEDAQDV